jgi:hypothetical protein
MNNDTPKVEKEKTDKEKSSMFMTFMGNDVGPPLRMNFMASDAHLGTGFYSIDAMESVLGKHDCIIQ